MSQPTIPPPDALLTFWFDPATQPFWFTRSLEFDARVKEDFEPLYHRAIQGDLETWKQTPRGCLALILLFDQVPRNIFRNTPKAFASDPLAQNLTTYVLEHYFDVDWSLEEKLFLYLPYEHAEDLALQEMSARLYQAATENQEILYFVQRHKEIIERFGRFPHRNQILGRQSTAEEIEFLKQPNSSF